MNAWKLAVGEKCLLDGKVWVRCPNVSRLHPTLPILMALVLCLESKKSVRREFLLPVEVDLIEDSKKILDSE